MVFYHLLPLWSLCVTLQGGCPGVLTVFPSVDNQESDKHLPFPVRKNVKESLKGNVKKIIALENATYAVVKSCEKPKKRNTLIGGIRTLTSHVQD